MQTCQTQSKSLLCVLKFNSSLSLRNGQTLNLSSTESGTPMLPCDNKRPIQAEQHYKQSSEQHDINQHCINIHNLGHKHTEDYSFD